MTRQAWKVIPNGNLHLVQDADGVTKGLIKQNGDWFEVEMLMVRELNRSWKDYNEAVAYVRGIEAMVKLRK